MKVDRAPGSALEKSCGGVCRDFVERTAGMRSTFVFEKQWLSVADDFFEVNLRFFVAIAAASVKFVCAGSCGTGDQPDAAGAGILRPLLDGGQQRFADALLLKAAGDGDAHNVFSSGARRAHRNRSRAHSQ